MATYNYQSGLGNSAAYQVSGIPYVTGNIDCTNAGGERLKFPSVTSWVVVSNNATASAGECRVAFSKNGLKDAAANYYLLATGSQTPRLEVKVTEIHISGSNSVSIMAGLTSIDNGQIDLNTSVSPSGSNWSGSLAALVG